MNIRNPRWYFIILVGVLVLAGLYFSSLYNYLLFHSFAEVFSIIVAFGIFIVAWNSRRFLDNNYFIFIGIAYLFVGHMDLIHTLAYPGMGVLPGYGTNTAAQLWIVARYLESLSLLVAPLLIGRKLRVNFLFPVYGLTILIAAASIFYWQNFPVCFIEGIGLTSFKIISEYVISVVLLGSIFVMFLKRKEFDTSVLRLLLAAIIVTVASELAFTLYEHPFGLPNLIGHFLKIISFYLIYKAIIETGLVRPYDLLFRNLKHSKEFLENTLESLTHPFYVVNANDYTVEIANSAARLGELTRNTKCYTLTHRNSKPCSGLEHPCPLEEVKKTRKPVNVEHIHYDRYGNETNVEVNGYPIFDKEGNVTQMITYCLDITERKKLDQLKDDFISLVSHELRSPMTVITGAINTALTEAERLSPEETRQLLKDAALEAELLSNILGNLLELSRIQANRLSLHAEAVSVGKVIQDAVNEVKRQSSAHQFVVNLPRKLPPVYADELRLERILYNLLENAVKYSPPGSKIRVSVRPEKEHLVIGVSDQGTGISPSDQAKIFGPFQRLEESRPDGARGVGLGLLVCRRLVEAHGGQIWVESEPGRGSTFFFTMPLSNT